MNKLRPDKYGFKVRTRNGAIVERVLINGDSEEDAKLKLMQMYYHCEVLECWRDSQAPKVAGASFEDVVDLINR